MPASLSMVRVVGERTVHAEEWRPGGETIRDDGPEAAARSAWLLADLMRCLEGIRADPPLPNPAWVGWDHEGPGDFPPNPRHDPLAATTPLPAVIVETAPRVRARLLKAALRPVVGHADWEAQNMRWVGAEPDVVYDWDSLAWLPEAAVVGAAAGMFASAEGPILAPLESSIAFLDAYQVSRGRTFTVEERVSRVGRKHLARSLQRTRRDSPRRTFPRLDGSRPADGQTPLPRGSLNRSDLALCGLRRDYYESWRKRLTRRSSSIDVG